jgi:hypothetical protein
VRARLQLPGPSLTRCDYVALLDLTLVPVVKSRIFSILLINPMATQDLRQNAYSVWRAEVGGAVPSR